MNCTNCEKYAVCGLIAGIREVAIRHPGLRFTQEAPSLFHLVAANCQLFTSK